MGHLTLKNASLLPFDPDITWLPKLGLSWSLDLSPLQTVAKLWQGKGKVGGQERGGDFNWPL